MNRNLTLILFILCAHFATAQNIATYTVESKTSVSQSGNIPQGSSAIFSNDSPSATIITKDDIAILTLSGYDNMTISKITLTMHSKTDAGAGSLRIKIGSTSVYSHNAYISFDHTLWNGSFSSSYVPIVKTIDSVKVGSDENIEIKITGFSNYLYINKYEIEYSYENTTKLTTPNNLSVSNITSSSADIQWDAVPNADSYDIYIANTDTFNTSNNYLSLSNLQDNNAYSLCIKALSKNIQYESSDISTSTSFTTLVGIPYTVSFDAGDSGQVQSTSLTEQSYRTGIILPEASLNGDIAAEYYFIGWSNSKLALLSSSIPTIYPPLTKYYPTSNCTLYAVYRSLNNIENKQTISSTSILNPNDQWIVKHSEDQSDNYWALCIRDTIFMPPLADKTYVENITVTIHTHKINSDNLLLRNNNKTITSYNITNSDPQQITIPVIDYLQGQVYLVNSSTISTFYGLALHSAQITADIPKYAYFHNPLPSLGKTMIKATAQTNGFTINWTSVPNATSYTIMVNDSIVTTQSAEEIQSYNITNLDAATRYKISILANPSQNTTLPSYTHTYTQTLHNSGEDVLTINNIEQNNPYGLINISHTLSTNAIIKLKSNNHTINANFNEQSDGSWQCNVFNTEIEPGDTIEINVYDGNSYSTKTEIIPHVLNAQGNSPRTVNISSIESSVLEINKNVHLNVNKNTTLKSIRVENGASLSIVQGARLETEDLTIVSQNNEVPELNIRGSLFSHFGIRSEKTIDDSKFYFISLPFSCPVNSIRNTEGENIGIYGTDWIICKYCEHTRATNGNDISMGNGSGWVDLNLNDTLYKDYGYIIAQNDTENTQTFVFQQQLNTNTLITDASELSTTSSNLPNNSKHNGWNLVSSGSLGAQIGAITHSAGITNIPISIPTEDTSTYTQGLSSVVNRPPFISFFVQVPESGNLNFPDKSQQNTMVLNNEDYLILNLCSGNVELDNTTITFSNNAQDDFNIGYDLEKLASFNNKPLIYVCEHQMKLAVSNHKHVEKDTIKLGLFIAEMGEYHIILPEKCDYATLINTDHTGPQPCKELTISVMSDSVFMEDCIQLLIDRSITNTENIYEENSSIEIIDGNILINSDTEIIRINIYNSNGQLLRSYNKQITPITISNLTPGTYFLRIEDTTKANTHKLIVK